MKKIDLRFYKDWTGSTHQELGDEFGVHKATITRWLKDNEKQPKSVIDLINQKYFEK